MFIEQHFPRGFKSIYIVTVQYSWVVKTRNELIFDKSFTTFTIQSVANDCIRTIQ